ncbi:hypothetical protein NPIL_488351 [Nephila pilipes]|uniref:Uncharacterized protein n=1 Tax=Nephila pilipes TaxID=299642 RepID=A0A8X6P1K0_NEPPI|nr:hypothetical protein NPIL_488351 [Nephila pilipes]
MKPSLVGDAVRERWSLGEDRRKRCWEAIKVGLSSTGHSNRQFQAVVVVRERSGEQYLLCTRQKSNHKEVRSNEYGDQSCHYSVIQCNLFLHTFKKKVILFSTRCVEPSCMNHSISS